MSQGKTSSHRLTLHFYLSWILTFSKTCCVCVCVCVCVCETLRSLWDLTSLASEETQIHSSECPSLNCWITREFLLALCGTENKAKQITYIHIFKNSSTGEWKPAVLQNSAHFVKTVGAVVRKISHEDKLFSNSRAHLHM